MDEKVSQRWKGTRIAQQEAWNGLKKAQKDIEDGKSPTSEDVEKIYDLLNYALETQEIIFNQLAALEDRERKSKP